MADNQTGIDNIDAVMGAEPWDNRDVAHLFALEPIGGDGFRAFCNQRNVNDALFGGQVVAQALAAAVQTAGGQDVHSLHCYFIRPGSNNLRVSYKVERLRDGRNFTTRRVAAKQGGRLLLELICSFTTPQHGFHHQAAMPTAPLPEGLELLTDLVRAGGVDMPAYAPSLGEPGPIEMKPFNRRELVKATGEARRSFWFRAPGGAAINDAAGRATLLAYLSDYWFASAALTAHCAPCPGDDLFVASLDHAVWFHQPMIRSDDWLLYQIDSPYAQAGIGTVRGLIFDRAGRLLASTAQQALQLPSATAP